MERAKQRLEAPVLNEIGIVTVLIRLKDLSPRHSLGQRIELVDVSQSLMSQHGGADRRRIRRTHQFERDAEHVGKELRPGRRAGDIPRQPHTQARLRLQHLPDIGQAEGDPLERRASHVLPAVVERQTRQGRTEMRIPMWAPFAGKVREQHQIASVGFQTGCVFEERFETGQTGAQWQLRTFEKYRREADTMEACRLMLANYVDNIQSGTPVAGWC